MVSARSRPVASANFAFATDLFTIAFPILPLCTLETSATTTFARSRRPSLVGAEMMTPKSEASEYGMMKD